MAIKNLQEEIINFSIARQNFFKTIGPIVVDIESKELTAEAV